MTYLTNLFSPETYEAFLRSPRDVSGFRLTQQKAADHVKPGDVLICYITRISRWFGLLEVQSGPFIDSKPIFVPDDDPFVVRFRVKPLVVLIGDKTIPIHDDAIWDRLSFTQGVDKGVSTWTGKLRRSLGPFDPPDGKFLAERLLAQAEELRSYAMDEQEQRKLTTHVVNRPDKVVSVSVPEDPSPSEEAAVLAPEVESRDSIKVQSLLAQIGARMGMSIWIPRSDRGGVLREWKGEPIQLLERLPLSYDDTTLRTIEQIDVLWLKGRSIVRAFEVEHTTSVYSGILRMADLLALQPNMDIKLHIVAPVGRRDKVFQEIRRPVFALLDRGPLAESCTYLSYDSVNEISQIKHLAHVASTVLDEYAEVVE